MSVELIKSRPEIPLLFSGALEGDQRLVRPGRGFETTSKQFD